jgi:hypothetical protein
VYHDKSVSAFDVNPMTAANVRKAFAKGGLENPAQPEVVR